MIGNCTDMITNLIIVSDFQILVTLVIHFQETCSVWVNKTHTRTTFTMCYKYCLNYLNSVVEICIPSYFVSII